MLVFGGVKKDLSQTLQTTIWKLKAGFENRCMSGWSQKLRWYRKNKSTYFPGGKKKLDYTVPLSSTTKPWVYEWPYHLGIISVSFVLEDCTKRFILLPSLCDVKSGKKKSQPHHIDKVRTVAWRVHHFHGISSGFLLKFSWRTENFLLALRKPICFGKTDVLALFTKVASVAFGIANSFPMIFSKKRQRRLDEPGSNGYDCSTHGFSRLGFCFSYPLVI